MRKAKQRFDKDGQRLCLTTISTKEREGEREKGESNLDENKWAAGLKRMKKWSRQREQEREWQERLEKECVCVCVCTQGSVNIPMRIPQSKGARRMSERSHTK